MGEQDAALQEHRAVVLEMDLGQQSSFLIIHALIVRGWQVKYHAAPVTLKVRCGKLAKFLQKKRHEHWGPGTAGRVHGFDMFA